MNCILQDNEMLKQALKQAKHEYDVLEKYYERARMYNKDLEEELEEIADENVELFRENGCYLLDKIPEEYETEIWEG